MKLLLDTHSLLWYAFKLFLDEGHYVNVPLEESYATAYRGVPRRWQPELDASIKATAQR